MFLFIGGSKHGKFLNVEKNYKIIFPRIFPVRYYPEYNQNPTELRVHDGVDGYEVYTLEKLGDPKTMKIKEVFVVEGVSHEKALELLNMVLLEWFINGV